MKWLSPERSIQEPHVCAHVWLVLMLMLVLVLVLMLVLVLQRSRSLAQSYLLRHEPLPTASMLRRSR